MTDHHSDPAAEAGIRAVIDERVRAIHEKDIEPLVNAVAPDVILFDALDSLQRKGAKDVRAKTTQWLGFYEGPIGYEVRDLNVIANDEVGFCSYLYRVTGTMKNGASVDMWVRSTICLQKMDGAWRILHEHTSVPFDSESGQALATLTP